MHARGFRVTPRWVILLAVAVLLVLSEMTHSGDFFSKATLSTLTPFVGVMLIASLGQAIVIGSGGIDLSIPATMTLVGVITLKVSESRDDRLASAAVAVVGPAPRSASPTASSSSACSLNPFVATLAMGQIVAGIARYIRGPVPQYTRVPPALVDKARWNAFGISMTLIVAVVVTVVGALVLRSTVSGRRLVASSASRPAAALIGLRASSYRITTYVLCSLLAGIAAFMLSGQLGAPDLSLGAPYLLATVVSVVLSGAVLSGGRVDLLGVALGADVHHRPRLRPARARLFVRVAAGGPGIVLAGGLAGRPRLPHPSVLVRAGPLAATRPSSRPAPRRSPSSNELNKGAHPCPSDPTIVSAGHARP